MTALGLAAYRAATGLFEPLARRALWSRARKGKEDFNRLSERLGHPSLPRPLGPLVWLHGASVGECLSLLPLLERLHCVRPELALLVTSGTLTSAELLARRLPWGVNHQFAPIDTPASAKRFLSHWRPGLLVAVESELWPNLLMTARERGCRTALVSARLSESSLKGWARARDSAAALLGGFDLLLPQDDETAARLVALGGRDDGRLNLKLAGAPLPVDEAALAAAEAATVGRPVLLAASTHDGDEAAALQAFAALASREPAPLLVIVPRHPVRGPEIVGVVQAQGLTATLGSRGEAFGSAPVHVADALGELGLWLRLCRAVYIGGALQPGVGGHNPLEPARLDRPFASGPHVDNWRSVYGALDAAGAVAWTGDVASLGRFWRAALDGEPRLAEQSRAALAYAGGHAGALDAAVERLLAFVP